MPRVKRGTLVVKARKNLMKMAKGYRGARSRRKKCASEAVMHALKYSYRDRRVKKRDFRNLWITRINAGARMFGMSYNRLVDGLNKAGVSLNRKILADLAVSDIKAFEEYVKIAQAQIEKAYSK